MRGGKHSMNDKKKTDSRDVFGRNLSYLLSCHQGRDKLRSIDLCSYDLESGYTPLHACLKLGYLHKAFILYQIWKNDSSASQISQENIWEKKDREGLTPMELFRCENEIWNLKVLPIALYPEKVGEGNENSSLIHWQPRFKDSEQQGAYPSILELRELYHTYRGGRELFTFGSNINMQLGTGDSDDRQKLFKLDEYQLGGGQGLDRVRFKSTIMTRYQSLLVTTDDKIFIAGNASRGRLGNGTLNVANFKHTQVNLDSAGIKQVTASDHHVIVLTSSNEVISWGWNRYFQLGYSTSSYSNKFIDKAASENICSPQPKKLAQCPWKKTWSGEVQFIACSKVHSCLIDDNNYLYSWGLNLGQMGVAKNFNKELDTFHAGHRGCVVSCPSGIKLPDYVRNIKQLLCTDFATFILFDDNQLCVMNDYKRLRFTIPKATSKQQSALNQFDVFTPISLSKRNSILKIRSSNIFGLNLSILYENGTVGIVQVKNMEESAHSWSKYPNILPITLYWIPFFKWNKCLDFDVGAKGQLVVCTVGGDIYKAENPNIMQFHRQRSGKLISGKCIGISCDSLFSSFATIKDDVDMIPIGFSKNNLYRDFNEVSPINNKIGPRTVKDIEMSQKENLEVIYDKFLKPIKSQESLHGMVVDSVPDSTSLDRTCDSLVKRSMDSWFTTPSLECSKMYSKCRPAVINYPTVPCFNRNRFDVLFLDTATKKVIAGCHSALLQIRSPVFMSQLMKNGYISYEDEYGVQMQLQGWPNFRGHQLLIEVASNKLPAGALLYALHFMYTDERPQCLNNVDAALKRNLELAMLQFLRILDINVSSYKNNRLPGILMHLLDIENSANYNDLFSKPDVTIHLADSTILRSYSFVLASRCAYFESLLSPDWMHEHDSTIDVDMRHVSKTEFLVILKYLHGCPFNELFKHCIFQNPIELIELSLNIIQVCDQILLGDLKHYLESILVDFIDGGTVIPLLINSYRLSCMPLALECCWYLYNNIDILFSDRNMKIIADNFDETLWTTLEEFVRNLRLKNSTIRFPSWYDDETTSLDLIGMFDNKKDKFNEMFMGRENSFKPVFDLNGQPKARAGSSRKTSDRRKSSSSGTRKVSISQEDLTNIRRPSVSVTDFRRPSFTNINYGNLGKSSESAIDDEVQDGEGKGFITVTKIKRKKSSSQEINSSLDLQKDLSTRLENVVKFEKTTTIVTSSAPASSSSQRSALFPALSKALHTSVNIDKSSVTPNVEPPNAPFASVKKLSQKERMKLLAEEKSQQTAEQKKKPVWGGSASKKSVAGSNGSSTNKFPSISESLQQAPAKRKSSAVSLTSTGTSATIPLYLNNARKMEPTPTRSIRETMEEERFAKWWAEESAKVQENLKRQEEAGRSLFDGVHDPAQKPPKKHVKDKRQRRPRNKFKGIKTTTL